LIFLEHALHQNNADLFLDEWVFIECIANDVGESPRSEEVLVQFLELALPVVQGEFLIDGIGLFVKLFIIGGIALPFSLLHERVDHFL
jgi:hypothetical protein